MGGIYQKLVVERFLDKARPRFGKRLLVLARWSHSGGHYSHILFESPIAFENFVRALPKREHKTNLLAFPGLEPDAMMPCATIEELRGLVHQATEGESYLMVPIRTVDYSNDPLEFPHSYKPVYEASEYIDDPSVSDEHKLAGTAVAFYRIEPHWDSGHDFSETTIGFGIGAY